MTKSYKMLVLMAMLNTGTLPGPAIRIEALVREFRRLARRSIRLAADVGSGLEDDKKLRRTLERYPIDAWMKGEGTGGVSFFEYLEGVFRFRREIAEGQRGPFRQMVPELTEWRVSQYLAHKQVSGASDAVLDRR